MERYFGTNTLIEEAAATSKRRSVVNILLMFLAVFGIGSLIAGSIASLPMTYFAMFDDELMSLMMSDSMDMEAILEAYESAMPSWGSVFSLIGNAGIIIATVYYCTKLERRRLFTLGFTRKNAIPEYILGLLIGLSLFGLAYVGILVFDGADMPILNTGVSIPILLLFFVGYVIQGMAEEVLLRSFLFISLSARLNTAVAVAVNSGLFALLHLANPGVTVLSIINLFLFGVFASLYFLRRGSIWGIGAVHTIWNFAQGNIFGCSVSGTGSGESLLTTVFRDNASLVNGGAFGPEGGLPVTVVLVIGIIVVLFMKNKEVVTPNFDNLNGYFNF